MSSWVKVGAKAICVKRDPWTCVGGPHNGLTNRSGPAYGEIVEIVWIGPGHGGQLCIQVTGHPFTSRYKASRFRPLVSQSDDAAMFTEIARTAKLDATTEQLERAWRESDHVIADDQSLRWIEDHPRKDDSK